MKTTLLAILLAAAAGNSNAGSLAMPGSLSASPAGAASSAPIFEAASRSGSRRVGGSGRSGKGSHYVGRRRR